MTARRGGARRREPGDLATEQVYREVRGLKPHERKEAFGDLPIARSVLCGNGARVARRARELGLTGDVLQAVRRWRRARASLNR